MHWDDDKPEMTDDELIKYMNDYRPIPHMSEQYEKRYKQLFQEKELGHKINIEIAEHLQKYLTQTGSSRFVERNKLVRDE